MEVDTVEDENPTQEEETSDALTKNLKEILVNMLQKCKIEATENLLQIPLEDYEDRVSYYTGIPKSCLLKLQDKESACQEIPIAIDFETHIIILKHLCELYKCKQYPTFRQLYVHLESSNLILPNTNFDHFKKIITGLGIDYQTIFKNTRLLMEDPNVMFERCSYLKKINKIRQTGALIYYVSEKLVDPDKGYTLLHAISKDSFTSGLFCVNPTEDDFFKWIVDILLELLNPSSVVILDKNALKEKLESNSKPITMYNTKCEMLKWLRSRNVPCSVTMNKFELYELVKKYPFIEETSRTERILKANGHEVLLLPTHFKGLSPIELLWESVKNWKHNQVRSEILQNFVNMDNKRYLSFDKTIEERENEINSLDLSMENNLDTFLLHLKST